MSGATKLLTPGGGGVTIQPASSIASDVTVNVPSQNCTLGIQGPAFSAYQSSGQSIATLTQTAVVLQTEEFDTNNNFASSAFTPAVAGYYQLNGTVSFGGVSNGGAVCSIGKNGAIIKSGQFTNTNTTFGTAASVSSLVYLNGTTDYVQLYVFVVTGSTSAAGSATTYFNGALVRAA